MENIIETKKQTKEYSPPISGLRKFFLKVGGGLAVVLHPVFLYFYCFIFLHFTVLSFRPEMYFYGNILVVFLFTVCFPMLFTLIYAKDVHLTERRKRPSTLIFTAGCYFLCFLWFNFLEGKISSGNELITYIGSAFALTVYLKLLFLLIAGLVLLFGISFLHKISLHANGVGFLFALPLMPGVPVLAQHDVFPPLVLTAAGGVIIICCCVLLWQRVASGAHKIGEVVSGFCLGFGITVFMGMMIG